MGSTIANFETGEFYTGCMSLKSCESITIAFPYYDKPIKSLDKDNKKIHVYEAIGINESMITIKEEFINRSKEFYLNIKGEYKDEVTEFCNDINIHLLVDTTVYNKYSVFCFDGILIVELHEIENKKPEMTCLHPKNETSIKSNT